MNQLKRNPNCGSENTQGKTTTSDQSHPCRLDTTIIALETHKKAIISLVEYAEAFKHCSAKEGMKLHLGQSKKWQYYSAYAAESRLRGDALYLLHKGLETILWAAGEVWRCLYSCICDAVCSESEAPRLWGA